MHEQRENRRLAGAAGQPDDLRWIRERRPIGPHRLWTRFEADVYAERLAGAFLGRMAGCVLGAPVEFWSIDQMANLAAGNGDNFPPTDYWSHVPEPDMLRYGVSPRRSYTRAGLAGVPVDDDTMYTLLGLLIADEYGLAFTTEHVGQAWLKYLPHACTAEGDALETLRRGVPASQAASTNNPHCEWIGGSIRADPWGYIAPGWPERAAEMAHRDAFLSHRGEGIYGEMFFAAAIAAAFAMDDAVEALQIGLTEIPVDCALSESVRWALATAPAIRNYSDARAAVEARFPGIEHAHTLNNACLTVWGLTIGGTDFTRVIGETVAMGMDNDCTAATAGSIAGATLGRRRIPARWFAGFGDTLHSYLVGCEQFSIRSTLEAFERHARAMYQQGPPSPRDL